MGARCTGRLSCGAFEIDVFGNGWAYQVTAEDGRTAWVQDHAAQELQDLTGNFEDDQPLAELIEAQGELAI